MKIAIKRKILKRQIYDLKKNEASIDDLVGYIEKFLSDITPDYDKIKSELRYSESLKLDILVPMISTRQIVTARHLIANIMKGNLQDSIHEYFDFIINYNMGADELSVLEVCILFEMGELICNKFNEAE